MKKSDFEKSLHAVTKNSGEFYFSVLHTNWAQEMLIDLNAKNIFSQKTRKLSTQEWFNNVASVKGINDSGVLYGIPSKKLIERKTRFTQ